jgi:transcriptional regulator with XRE-family HTH domain
MDFPAALKDRRAARRLSQLELAVRAGTTQRHLSFIETGRSAPGRELVVRLTESLGLPLRERNELLLLAGYAPAYPQTALDSPDLAPVLAALTHILDAHLPYPAIVIDKYGQIVAANAGWPILADGCAEHLHGNAYRLALHPDGMAPRVANFAEWARHVLNALAAELARNPDERLAGLYAELRGYVPPARVAPGHLGFAVPLELRTSHGDLRLMTTISTFANALVSRDVGGGRVYAPRAQPDDQALRSRLDRRGGAAHVQVVHDLVKGVFGVVGQLHRARQDRVGELAVFGRQAVDQEADPAIALHVRGLAAALDRAEQEVVAVGLHEDHRSLR